MISAWSIIIAVISASGFWTLLTTILQNHKEKKNGVQQKLSAIVDQLNILEDRIQNMSKQIEYDKADQSRNKILQYGDQIRRKIAHSEQSYNQILQDIDNYLEYCSKHPTYQNNKAGDSIRLIRQAYHKCKLENSFI